MNINIDRSGAAKVRVNKTELAVLDRARKLCQALRLHLPKGGADSAEVASTALTEVLEAVNEDDSREGSP